MDQFRDNTLFKKGFIYLSSEELDIPCFDFMDRYYRLKAEAPYPVDTHPGRLEILYLGQGEQSLKFAKGNYRLRTNDVIVVFPGEEHHSGDDPRARGVLYAFKCFVQPDVSNFLYFHPRFASDIVDRLLHLPTRLFQGDPRLGELLDRIFYLYFCTKQPDRLLRIAGFMQAFVLLLLELGEKKAGELEPPHYQEVEAIQEYIANHLDQPIDIGSVLQKHTREHYNTFARHFRQKTGFPLQDYINFSRVEKAKQLLDDPSLTVTQIAFKTGFSSSQYFSSVFRKYTGTSPSKYRKTR